MSALQTIHHHHLHKTHKGLPVHRGITPLLAAYPPHSSTTKRVVVGLLQPLQAVTGQVRESCSTTSNGATGIKQDAQQPVTDVEAAEAPKKQFNWWVKQLRC